MSMEDKMKGLIHSINDLDENSMNQCKKRWDGIAKPLHSLGKLEEVLIQISGIFKSCELDLKKKALVVMCADNGVVEEKVTQTSQEVTAIVAENFLHGKTSAKLMAEHVGVDLFPVDIGMVVDSTIINKKIAYGTKNMTKEPAMTREEAIEAILIGIQMVQELKEKGYKIIATGEMGIGNTTTSSAVASVLLDAPVEEVTGRGAGLSTEGLQRKIDAIKRAISLNQPNREDAIDVLAKVGGFDLAGLTGVFLGGAIERIPIVVDGFISSVAALTAIRINPLVEKYVIASHVSKEPAGMLLLNSIGKTPMITCDMCCGEGTGAVAFMPLLDLAECIYSQMSTFEQIHVEEYQELC